MPSLIEPAAGRKVTWLSVLGLVLIPLVVAGGFVWANWNSADRLDRVQAAIVNLDEPVKVGDQTVPLGRELSGGLVDGGNQENYDWVLSDQNDAKQGVESGKYAAVVTIPSNFSAAATSYSKDEPEAAEQATLEVTTSKVKGLADSALSQAIASAATSTLNRQLTETYLDNIYVGFNDIGEQFSSVADASGQLADGASELSKGIGQADQGSQDLASGLTELSGGAGELAEGTSQLNAGVSGLAKGLSKLEAGTAQLPAQTRQLANGADELASGADGIGDGASELAGGAEKLDEQVPKLADGAEGLESGATELADGLSGLSTGVQAQSKVIQGLVSACAAAPADPVCQQLGVNEQSAKLKELSTRLPQGAEQSADGAKKLATGAGSYAAGVDKFGTGVGKLASGADDLAAGGSQLSDGANAFAQGTQKLADGMPNLAAGISGAAEGSKQLATGAAKLDGGAQALAKGTEQSADGADKFSAGIGKLADGGEQLDSGSQQLADGLDKGAKQIPSYSATERSTLSTVVAEPVKQSGVSPSIFADVTAAGLLTAIALWIGALVTYLVVRAVTSRALLSAKPSWMLAMQGIAPGVAIAAVQALVLTILIQVILGLSLGRLCEVFVFTLLAGTTFVAINHALVAWFGGFGRFISVVLVVLTAAGGVTSAVPGFFDAIGPVLPLTPATDGIMAIASGGPGIGAAAAGLFGWLIVAVVASILAVVRQRSVTPARLAKLQGA
ncbi:YhgE/Pip domain-containing protein [Saxibacter everestensis]|uniref:YhgE/Pip domain-containing protein n=1 Tax=Saxibacter everestensis TaxID=2909229 RepID=A0ABY8QQE5_9MICO|nr:YhgE/Pip domain-containing protein [Brevibacteriaceae bacterium ZFBP1038]